jgi:hypothetical protein
VVAVDEAEPHPGVAEGGFDAEEVAAAFDSGPDAEVSEVEDPGDTLAFGVLDGGPCVHEVAVPVAGHHHGTRADLQWVRALEPGHPQCFLQGIDVHGGHGCFCECDPSSAGLCRAWAQEFSLQSAVFEFTHSASAAM